MSQANSRPSAFVQSFMLIVACFVAVTVSTGSAIAAPSDGSLDSTFNPGGSGFDSITEAVAVDAAGKVIVGGMFTSYNGTTANRLIRLNSDGSIDGTFNTGSGIPSGKVNDIVVLNDGSLLVGGSFTQYSGVTVSRLIKLSSSGALDTTFSANLGSLNGQVTDILPLVDGTFIATGQFTSGIMKFNVFGQKDTPFATNVGDGFSRGGKYAGEDNGATVVRAIQQSNGNLLVVGNFDGFKGSSAPIGLASLDLSGTLVTSFQTNLGTGMNTNGGGNAVVELTSGKLIVGGGFSSFNSSSVGNIVGLNADGTLDTTFNKDGLGSDRQIDFFSVDSNGNVLVSFQNSLATYTYNGATIAQTIRITSNGALDTSFVAPVVSFKTLPLPSGDVYVTGFFTTYGAATVGRFMRLTVITESEPSPEDPSSSGPTSQVESDSDAIDTALLARTGPDGSLPLTVSLSLLIMGAVALIGRQVFARTGFSSPLSKGRRRKTV